MTTKHLPTPVRAIAEATLTLASTLTEATAVQWSPSMAPKPREDTTERASGGHGDPTATTAVDDRRLAVRAAVDEGYAELAAAVETVKSVDAKLRAALLEWAGN